MSLVFTQHPFFFFFLSQNFIQNNPFISKNDAWNLGEGTLYMWAGSLYHFYIYDFSLSVSGLRVGCFAR